MHILITGATGYIGSRLCHLLAAQGISLSAIVRDIAKAQSLLPDNVSLMTTLDPLAELEFDGVINLAGAPIADKRWSKSRKAQLIESRVGFSEKLFTAIQQIKPPKFLINASAIGIYGAQSKLNLDEESALNQQGFAQALCQAWEQSTQILSHSRICLMRIAVVLGAHSPFLKKIHPSFNLGLGAILGEGTQWCSWIHIDDLLRAICFCMENHEIQGPVNCSAPYPVAQEEFADQYAKLLNRPRLIKLPGSVLRLLLGDLAQELMITGQHVVPKKLLQHGFNFNYPKLDIALRHIIKHSCN